MRKTVLLLVWLWLVLLLTPVNARADHTLPACFTPAPGVAIPGATITLVDDAQVLAKFCGSDAGFTSDLYLTAPSMVYIATGHVTATGHVVDIGAHNTGEELVFSIYVRNTGDTFYSGPGFRNPDGQVHAAILDLGGGNYHVGFEDLFGGGDRDYDDVIFLVNVEAVMNDQDGDDVADEGDNCSGVFNPGQENADGDGLGDACDACALDPDNDGDGDGVCGDVDNCPAAENASQSDNDSDTVGDVCDADDDNDAVADGIDNCPLISNGDQWDLDLDGAGNACDADDDGDAVIDGSDACLATPPDMIVNGDGCAIVDLCPCASTWKNHGAYVSCVAQTTNAFAAQGLIAIKSKGEIVSWAAQNSCGK